MDVKPMFFRRFLMLFPAIFRIASRNFSTVTPDGYFGATAAEKKTEGRQVKEGIGGGSLSPLESAGWRGLRGIPPRHRNR